MLIGRDTRASGRELERAFASGVASAGGHAVLAGVLPTPAVALLSLDLGAVISASHNPPEYNGVKLFDGDGGKLSDAAEEKIEALLESPPSGEEEGGIDNLEVVGSSYVRHVVERFGGDLSGLKLAVDCANGAYSAIAPKAFEELGAEVVAIGDQPDGSNINVGCGATDLRRCSTRCWTRGARSASPSTATATGCWRSTSAARRRRRRDSRGARARPRRRPRGGHADDEPRLPPAHGRAEHPRRHDRCRRPLRARGVEARGRRPRRRAVGSHHLPRRPRDGRRARRCAAALQGGRPVERCRKPRPCSSAIRSARRTSRCRGRS